MNTIRINGPDKKRLATYKGELNISELNSIILGEAPNRYSMVEKLYGKGAYAIRHVKK